MFPFDIKNKGNQKEAQSGNFPILFAEMAALIE
jgi:hypothetical protein